MRHTAHLRFDLGDHATAEAVLTALQPEADDGPPGTTTRLAREDAAIDVDIEADDLAGLRAALHGIVRLIDAAHAVVSPT